MLISRRTFLKATVGVAAGLIVPSWLERVERFIEAEEQPYLERPGREEQTLHAVDWGGGDWQFALDDPWEEPVTDMTWEEYLARFSKRTFEDYFEQLKSSFPDVELEYFQSNVEGELIDKIQGTTEGDFSVSVAEHTIYDNLVDEVRRSLRYYIKESNESFYMW